MSDYSPMQAPERLIFVSLMRGLRRCRPQCGDGTLLARYLTPVENCNICGEDFSAISILMMVMLAGVIDLLPRAKGLFIALIWATGATGEDYTVGKTHHNRRGKTSRFSEKA